MNLTKKIPFAKKTEKLSRLAVTSFLLFTSSNFYALAQAATTYSVAVKTGCVDSAGTDANVKVNILGENGASGWKALDYENYNDFERCAHDIYSVNSETNLGKIQCIELTHDNKGNKPGWYVDYVTVNGVTFWVDAWIAAPNSYIRKCIF